jgi:hypothetical protein
MSNVLERGIINLAQEGFYDVALPFILIFTIIFAVLQKVKIFEQKKVNVSIAFVMALIPIFQHILYRGPGRSIIDIINGALPQVALVVIAIVMLLIMLGVFGANIGLGNNKASGWIMGLSIAAIIFIFGSSAGFGWYDLPYWISDDVISDDVITIAVALLVFGIIIAFVTKDDDNKKDPSVFEELSKLVKK